MQDKLHCQLGFAARAGTIGAVAILAVLLVARAPTFVEQDANAQALPLIKVSGVAANQSSARVYYRPVVGAKDYRIYDVANPTDVKYAGLAHRTASAACPGSSCQNHFVVGPDGTPVFPYQVSDGGSGGPHALDGPATDIEWNGLGDGQPHTLVVEAVDQLGPVPKTSLYTGPLTTPLVDPLPAGVMLGMNKGETEDGNVSTNGQGPFSDIPQPIARSAPLSVQSNTAFDAIPSGSDASQTFFDTFDNSEAATIELLSRQDTGTDAVGDLGSMTYSMNKGTPREWNLEFRQADNANTMPFIANDHFMDVLFDGATPGTSAPSHTTYGSMSMTPAQTVSMDGGQVLHLTMEVDAHQSFRRWVAFDLAPASDPLQGWDPSNHPINNSDRGLFMELRDGFCTLDIYAGAKSNSNLATGTAGGSHGARLWGQPGASGGGAVPCDLEQMYNPGELSKNGLGLDDRSRLDLFISKSHAALFEDGRLVVQSDVPAGTFGWADEPLRAYYSHYLYHSDADIADLETFTLNGIGNCYPLNSFWFNEPTTGTAASQDACGFSYPAGYGFPHSDERHWDNMGFEVLPASSAPTHDFTGLASRIKLPVLEAVQRDTNANTGPDQPPSSAASPTTAPAIDTSTPVPASTADGAQWANVTPSNVNLTSDPGCGNYGVQTVVADPTRATDLYADFNCQGIWKSTDYGQTWTGPINTGRGGAQVSDSAGGLAIAPGFGSNPPILFSAAIRGSGTGFWRSTDGGVSWTNYVVTPGGNRQDWYPPSVDPYDGNHLIMAAHEQNLLAETTDGGQTWTRIPMDGGMNENGGTADLFFINTGSADSTRTTWLYIAQGTSGNVGTWRTTNAGSSWRRVDSNEHPHGDTQIYQPDTSGVIYVAGIYSQSGWGVLRSADYGQTWTHVGANSAEAVVFGTANNIYAMYGWACGMGCDVPPALQVVRQPGTGTWSNAATPPVMTQGPASAAVVFDATHYVIVTANWTTGLWRYVEP